MHLPEQADPGHCELASCAIANIELQQLNAALEERLAARTAELEQAQQRLRQSEELPAFGQVAAVIAHDFNNLLATVGINLKIMRVLQQQARADDLSPYLSLAAAATESAVELMRSLRAPAAAAHPAEVRAPRPSSDEGMSGELECVAVLDQAPLGIYLIDGDFRICQANAIARRTFGAIPALIGRDFGQVMHLLWQKPYADELVDRFRHTLETGEAYIVSDRSEQRLDHGLNENYEWQISRLPLADGRHGVVCYFHDISERVLAKEKIRESEERYRSLFNSIDEGYCIIEMIFDDDGNPLDYLFLEVNASFEKQCGMTDAPGKRMLELAPNHEAYWFETYGAVVRSGESIRFIHKARELGNSWFDLYAFQLGGRDSRKVAVVFNNITQRMNAEEALRDSEERYRNLFNSIDEGFCIIEMIYDEHEQPVDYLFLEVNPTFEKQIGLLGAVGKRVRELLPAIETFWIELYGKVARTGEPVRLTHEVKSLNVLIDVYACRVGGPLSRKVAVVFNNIAERKQAEEALRQSEQRFRALFDWGPIAMYACDTAGAIQEYNRGAVALWGREPEHGELDEGAFESYPSDGAFLPLAQTPMAGVLKGDIPAAYDREILIRRPDGSHINVIANIVPLKNRHGDITGAIKCFYDITERKRLERTTTKQGKTLAELDRRKDEFLAMLSHELRNPLAALANAVQLLRLNEDADPVQRQACDIVERQTGQLKYLVDDLLDVSRITSGRITLRQQRIDVSGIVQRAVQTAQPFILQRLHEFTLALPQHPLWLNADAARLEQVVVNLLTNAAKYTDDGGHIWLTVQREGAAVVLRVRDTGIGIAADILPHIFDLFAQAERSLDRAQGGLGIGLCLVQRLVELHGGTVEAHSVLEQGSEFVVRLPALPDAAAPAPAPAPQRCTETAAPPGKYCRVLLVDDNVDLVRSLAKLLEVSGHEVRITYDGPSALDSVGQYRPDVVLLDIGLPGLSGFEVAKLIRQQAELKGIVLVAMTGYGQETDRKNSQEAGFDHHLVKPADFDALERILAAAGGRRASGR